VSATTQAALPTARSMAWTPVAVTATGLVAVAMLARATERGTPLALSLTAGALAALAVLALRDPAAALLAAVPLSAWRRRALRLAWIAAVVLPLWMVVTALLPAVGLGTALPALLALSASALAVAVWIPDGGDPGRAAALPLLWVAAGSTVGGVGGPVGDASLLWREHPWPLLAVAVVLLAAGSSR
jgi:hypothetical protein